MRITAAKAGWLILLAAIVGAALRGGRDDPLTAAMKSAGIYRPVLIGFCVVFGLLVVRLGFVTWQTVRLTRHLEQLRSRKGRR